MVHTEQNKGCCGYHVPVHSVYTDTTLAMPVMCMFCMQTYAVMYTLFSRQWLVCVPTSWCVQTQPVGHWMQMLPRIVCWEYSQHTTHLVTTLPLQPYQPYHERTDSTLKSVSNFWPFRSGLVPLNCCETVCYTLVSVSWFWSCRSL